MNLTGVILVSADMVGADVTSGNLRDANLTEADLTRANLTGARWPRSVPVPGGWKLKIFDARSGLLERQAPDSGPTEKS